MTDKFVKMLAGNLDGDINRALDSNIFIAHKACWFDILGEDRMTHFDGGESVNSKVSFCSTCSAPMPVHRSDSDRVMVPAGSIDQDPGIRPEAHYHIASKAPWAEITDNLPQHDHL